MSPKITIYIGIKLTFGFKIQENSEISEFFILLPLHKESSEFTNTVHVFWKKETGPK